MDIKGESEKEKGRANSADELVEKTRELLREHQLCDQCLGRQFAKLGHGLSNRERGRALRVLLSLVEDCPIAELETEHCELCLNQFAHLDEWVERALRKLNGIEFRSFLVGSRLPEFLERAERELQTKHGLRHAGTLKHDLNREVGKLLERKLAEQGREVEVDLRQPEVAILLDLVMNAVQIKISPLFIYGRYRKLIRGIPQTHWPCKRGNREHCRDGKMYPESVEELITPVLLEAAQGRKAAFHGAGREDIDARMLGTGRPFVVEISEPRVRSLDLQKLEKEINERAAGKVEVTRLQFTERKMVEYLKSAHAAKRYRALVRFAEPVDEERFQRALRELIGVIRQRTPQRVAHRRADLVRERSVYKISGKLRDDRTAELEIKCEGGLYVKELVSGDEGRTRPSLSELLGVPAEVTELDVLEILGKFP